MACGRPCVFLGCPDIGVRHSLPIGVWPTISNFWRMWGCCSLFVGPAGTACAHLVIRSRKRCLHLGMLPAQLCHGWVLFSIALSLIDCDCRGRQPHQGPPELAWHTTVHQPQYIVLRLLQICCLICCTTQCCSAELCDLRSHAAGQPNRVCLRLLPPALWLPTRGSAGQELVRKAGRLLQGLPWSAWHLLAHDIACIPTPAGA